MITMGRLLETLAVTVMFVAALTASCINTHAAAEPNGKALAAQEMVEAAGDMDTLATIRPKDGILLGADPLRIVFVPSEGLSIEGFVSKLRELAGNRQFYVVFDGVSVEAPPEIVYLVYLTAGATNEFRGAADPRYIGALQFFNAFGPTTQPGRSEAFNVTERIRSLARTELDSQPLCLWITPAGAPAKSSYPRVVDIRLVAEP
jgi:hypothetical protein